MTHPQHHEIVVIGAGIAGATITNELLARGCRVCIVDAASTPASACSSHAYAIAHPHVGRGSPRLLRLTRIAFLLAEARWGKAWNAHGIFQPSKKDKAFDRQELEKHLLSLELDLKMAQVLEANEAEKICGVKQNGIWLPRGASLNIAQCANELLKPHKNLTTLFQTHINRFEREGAQWKIFNDQGSCIITAQKIIITAAMGSKALMSGIGIRLPLKPVRGQLSIFSVAENDPWIGYLPKTAISGDGYCLPAKRQDDGSHQWIVGSSFDEGEDNLEIRESSDIFNREQAKGLVNYSQGDTNALQMRGAFVGVRCVAGDRLPIIGALTQRPGVYLATALGSRGVLWSALAAKLIAAQVLGDDFALLARLGFAADLVAALAPARFFAGALAVTPSPLGALASNSKPIFPSAPKAR